MRVWYSDLETFWSTEHSLTKMNPAAYCMHRETELQSMSCAFGDEPMEFIRGEAAMQEYVNAQDWSDVLVVGHNMSQFDSMLLAWRLGLRPKMWGCTLAMARAVYRAEVGGSLKALCDYLQLGSKGNLENIGTKGRKADSFTEEEWAAMEAYNNQDTHLTRLLFRHLLQHTPRREMSVIDMTIRMLVHPKIHVDTKLLAAAHKEETKRKVDAIEVLREKLGLPFDADVKKALMSNPQFAELLRSLGVEPPIKISPTTGKETYAFAKDDEGLLALREHENPLVGSAVETRLGIKSSMLETRIETFQEMAAATAGRMPIALNYAGAHTWRWSGGFKANQQNLPRVPRDKQGNIIEKTSNALRMSLIAPPGHKIVVADLSGIELRVNHYLWQVPSSMELYAGNAEADLYKEFAAKFYGIPVDSVSKQQRQFAKMMQLALGFGMGWRKFKVQANREGYPLTDYEAEAAVAKWRAVYDPIVLGWEQCANAISSISNGEKTYIDRWGFCVTAKHQVLTPEGLLRYPGLHRERNEKGRDEWIFGKGRNKSRIYGGLLCENLVQHLARQVLVTQMLEIHKRYPISHTVHDEVILVVKEEEAETALDFMLTTMKTSPDWWPEIVLFAEGDIGDRYGECK
jgi:DNA polymerase